MLWLAGAVLTLYFAYAVLMILLQPRFLYPFEQDEFAGQGYEFVEVPVEGAEPVGVWLYRGAPDAPVILYFMGNVGALELFRPMPDHHKAAGRSVVAMTYRGAGGIAGRSSETSLKRDALAVYDALETHLGFSPNGGPRIVQGYSLGTGIAMHVAAQRPADKVILVAPFDRLCDLMARASYLPVCVMPVQRWDSARLAENVTAPVLVVHGTADPLIPIAHGKRLAQRLGNARFEAMQGGAHNDLFGHPDYLPVIDTFVEGPL